MLQLRTTLAFAAAAALGVCLSPATAGAADLAPVGAKGTLTIKVKVEGAGKVTSEGKGAGWDYYTWSANNSATLRYDLTAMDPVVDTNQFAGLAAAANAGGDDEAEDEDDSDWEDAWDEKFDACNEDQACEFRVTQEKMKDPHFKKMQAKATGVMGAMMGGMPDMTPTVQPWGMPAGTVAGTVSINEQRDTYGLVSETGGPKEEQHCTISGQEAVKGAPSGYGDMDAMLRVNTKTSTYELTLEADESAEVSNSCAEGDKYPQSLLGPAPAGATSWHEVMAVKGNTGSSGAFNGQQTWQGNLATAGNEPVKVTVSWEFKPVTGH